jgi:hypothetical protein
VLIFVGSVGVLVLAFVASEIISVKRNTKDLEQRIRRWRGRNNGEEE